jgi:hypothetical protein
MFSKGVTFLAPPRQCVYHYYKTDKKIYVHDLKLFDEYYEKADKHIHDFFTFQLKDEFGITPDVIYKWIMVSRDTR